LFQVVFADVAVHLAFATFRLRKRRESDLVFEDVFRQEFKKTLKQFRCELRQIEGRSAVSDNVYPVREACKTMSKLAVRRNDRIHARVHSTQQGYALYDWRTRCRLEISQEQIEKNIQLAITAKLDLKAHVPHLVQLLEWDEEIENQFSTLPELSESEDAEADNDTA
jgi:hypothetical protein